MLKLSSPVFSLGYLVGVPASVGSNRDRSRLNWCQFVQEFRKCKVVIASCLVDIDDTTLGCQIAIFNLGTQEIYINGTEVA